MPILNPEHLLEQAQRLIQPPPAGPPRQVDLRRAISSAYYAVFHAIVTASADQLVGSSLRHTREHALVCRAIDHRTIRITCEELLKTSISARYRSYLPAGGFGDAITAVASALPLLQESRHAADYDTLMRYRTADAAGSILLARVALGAWTTAPPTERRALIFLLLFPPRR